MSAARLPAELLFDSAHGLKRAEEILGEWTPIVSAAPGLDQALELDPDFAMPLPDMLQRAYGEIVRLLENLNRSRSILEQAAADRLPRTNAKLREVTSTTESATTSILDSLERGLALLGELDTSAPEAIGPARSELRDLLHGMLAELQFQDITSQQLNHAATMLEDLEERLRAIAELIDASVFGGTHAHHVPLEEVRGQHFDPAATASDATARQALADQIFS